MTTVTRTSGETTVNVSGLTTTNSSVTALSDGGYVVVWASVTDVRYYDDYQADLGRWNVYGRRYDAAGRAMGEFRVDADDSLSRYDTVPSVSALADGGFVVGWTEEHQPAVGPYNGDPNDHGDIEFDQLVRVYEADGTAGPITTIGGAGSGDGAEAQELVTPTVVAGINGGGFIAAANVFFKAKQAVSFHDENGAPAGGRSTQNQPVDKTDGGLAVAGLTTGYRAVVWADSSGADGEGSGIFLRLFGPAGQLFIDGIQVNTGNSGDQYAPAITALKSSSGGFVVTWASRGANDDQTDIRAQVFSLNGRRVGGEFLVNTATAGDQTDPAIATLSGGGFVIVWTGSDAQIHGQRFAADGAKSGGEFLVTIPDTTPFSFSLGSQSASVAALANDGFVVTWSHEYAGNTFIQSRTFQGPSTGATATAALEVIDGTAGNDVINAAPGTFAVGDQIYGRGGTDRLVLTAAGTLDLTAPSAFSGIETIVGSSGNDTFIVSNQRLADVTSVSLGGGTDVFVVKNDFTLKAGLNVGEIRAAYGFERSSIDIAGNAVGQKITGGSGADTLRGMGGNDTLVGGSGADLLDGGANNDTYYVDGADIVVEGTNGGVDTVLASQSFSLGQAQVEILKTSNDAGTAAINLTGNALVQTITGNAGSNILDSGFGKDTLIGLGGNDTYVVYETGVRVIEAANAGTDTVQSAVTYTLGDNLERLILFEGFATDGYGNALANTLTGNFEANILDGKAGADTLSGLLGDDTYFVDNANDKVVETVGDSGDKVLTSVTYALAARQDIEILATTKATGTDAIRLTGNEIGQRIEGNAGANIIDGKGGIDDLRGFGGNDTYYVDDADDTVVEAVNGGTGDRVFTSVSYTLSGGQEIETLGTTIAAGTSAIALTGNEFAQTILGNAGNNMLDGKAGADRLYGYGGNDTYYVDNAGDTVFEASGGGTLDTVLAKVSYTLTAGQQVEVLSTSGLATTATINLAGNEFAQTIKGTDGINALDGKGGADTLQGFKGNDVYYVDNAGDRIVEAADGGSDRAYASASYTLGAGQSVELLATNSASGTGALSLTGNEIAQIIQGNAGGNVLDGKAGADTLSGFAGRDTFVFSTALGAANVDRITDFSHADDTIRLSKSVFGALDAGTLSTSAFKNLGVAGASVDADDRIIYNPNSGALFYDADGSGTGSTAIQFATLTNKPADLNFNDFLIA